MKKTRKSRWKKTIAATLTLAMAVSTFLTGCGDKGSEKQDEYVFKIGTANGSVCMAPLHIAEDNGYLKEEFDAIGIKYELVEIDVQQTADLVASGQIDAGVGLAGCLLPQIDNGLEITFTAGLHTGCTKYYVKADSDIKSLEDLKGKKIGVPGVSDSSVIALKRKLEDLGIKSGNNDMEFELAAYNMTDLPLALENGAVDVVAMHDPVATSAEKEYGFRKILDLTEDEKFKNEYCCTAYVSANVSKEHADAAAAYTRALLKASAYVEANPEKTAELQIKNNHCSGDAAENAKLLASYNYQPSVSAMRDTFKNAVNDLKEIGDLKTARDVDEFTDEHVASFDGVPDSYTYNEDGTFTEIKK